MEITQNIPVRVIGSRGSAKVMLEELYIVIVSGRDDEKDHTTHLTKLRNVAAVNKVTTLDRVSPANGSSNKSPINLLIVLYTWKDLRFCNPACIVVLIWHQKPSKKCSSCSAPYDTMMGVNIESKHYGGFQIRVFNTVKYYSVESGFCHHLVEYYWYIFSMTANSLLRTTMELDYKYCGMSESFVFHLLQFVIDAIGCLTPSKHWHVTLCTCHRLVAQFGTWYMHT